jgi:hypothetical protein
MKRHLVVALVLFCAAAPAHGQRPPYTPDQLTLVRRTADCGLSPDGRPVAFVSDITGARESWRVPAAGGWPVQLTSFNEYVDEIRWSPDGRGLLFASPPKTAATSAATYSASPPTACAESSCGPLCFLLFLLLLIVFAPGQLFEQRPTSPECDVTLIYLERRCLSARSKGRTPEIVIKLLVGQFFARQVFAR